MRFASTGKSVYLLAYLRVEEQVGIDALLQELQHLEGSGAGHGFQQKWTALYHFVLDLFTFSNY